MSVEIKEVTSKSDLHAFVKFPHTLYKKNPYWIPPLVKDELITLNKQKNPAFENCDAKLWLAYKDGKLVGRIAGIINKDFLRKWKNAYARFGWVDFIDDPEVSAALFTTVEDWAATYHMKAVHGPLGFTDFDPEGLLLEGFDKTSVMTTIYNFPYYTDHLEKNNYVADVKWVEFEVEIPRTPPERIQRMANVCRDRYDLHALQAKQPGDLLPYARDVFHLVNQTYSHLYGVVDLRERQIDFYLDQFFTFIDPDFTSIILNKSNEVVAFAIAMPSLSKALKKSNGKIFPLGWFYLYQAFRNNTVADLYLIAVHPALRKKGITGLIIEDLIHKFRRRKISKAYTHPILEHNGAMVNFWKQFQRTEFRKRGCFIKRLPVTN
jgi:GNAT superfamily N-acetyltransferase